METYREEMERHLIPLRPHARKTVEELGVTESLILSYRVPGPMQYAIWEEVARRDLSAMADPHDLTAAAHAPGLRALQTLVSETDKAMYGRIDFRGGGITEVSTQWHAYLHRLHGSKSYEISPLLARALHHTELRGVTTDQFRLPYPSVYITVPGAADLAFIEPEHKILGANEASRVEGVMVAEVRPGGVTAGMPSDAGAWGFLLIGAPPRVAIDGISTGITSDGIANRLIYSFVVSFAAGETLDEVIARRTREIENLSASIRAIYRSGAGIAPHWERFFRYAMNAILYITHVAAPEDIKERWENPEANALRDRIAKLPPGKKKDALKERLRKTAKRDRLYVHWPRPTLDDGDGSTGRPLLVRTLVTGHWRNQACGTAWQERKLIWIAPFWRGPIGSEESNPRRIVT